ncbi:MAG TPA: hypothetical protein VK859_00920, partial [bacterium]|nr:hypothetical protein [bacterium]
TKVVQEQHQENDPITLVDEQILQPMEHVYNFPFMSPGSLSGRVIKAEPGLIFPPCRAKDQARP